MSLAMDVWHLSPGLPGQHSVSTSNLELDESSATSHESSGTSRPVQLACHVVWFCVVHVRLAGSGGGGDGSL